MAVPTSRTAVCMRGFNLEVGYLTRGGSRTQCCRPGELVLKQCNVGFGTPESLQYRSRLISRISEIDACCDHIRVAARGDILATRNRPAYVVQAWLPARCSWQHKGASSNIRPRQCARKGAGCSTWTCRWLIKVVLQGAAWISLSNHVSLTRY
jgi:hypothetical protein